MTKFKLFTILSLALLALMACNSPAPVTAPPINTAPAVPPPSDSPPPEDVPPDNPPPASEEPVPPPPPPPPTPPAGDTKAPTILSISPRNAAIGVVKNVKIVIDFSEPMHRQATERAYQSGDLPPATFTWSNNSARLEIDPLNDLEYGPSGTIYSFRLRSDATDLAGNPLAPVSSSFKTFRELTTTLKSVDALDGHVFSNLQAETEYGIAAGDVDLNLQVKGFISFDLGGLEASGLTAPNRITAATLRMYQNETTGSPFLGLELNGKRLLLAHVSYGAGLNGLDFITPILRDLGQISGSSIVGWRAPT